MIRLFLARGLHDVPADDRHHREHEEADLTVRRVPLDEAVRMVLGGEITNAAAAVGVLAAARPATRAGRPRGRSTRRWRRVAPDRARDRSRRRRPVRRRRP